MFPKKKAFKGANDEVVSERMPLLQKWAHELVTRALRCSKVRTNCSAHATCSIIWKWQLGQPIKVSSVPK
eukprot:SAG11_NODE_3874_length_2177_cov_1.636670_5_plen_69_part_01